jgi:hypothetical protein
MINNASGCRETHDQYSGQALQQCLKQQQQQQQQQQGMRKEAYQYIFLRRTLRDRRRAVGSGKCIDARRTGCD